MTGGSVQLLAGLEQWLDRRYARRRIGFLYECYSAACVLTMVLYALAAGGLTLLLDGSSREFLLLLAIVEGLAVAVLPLGFWIWSSHGGRASIAWQRGSRSSATAPAAWLSVVSTPIQIPLINLALVMPFAVAGSFLAAAVLDHGVASVPVILVGTLMVTVAIAGTTIFAAQLAVRPLLREIAPYMPPDTEFARSRFGLGPLLVIRLVVVAFMMLLVGGVTTVVTDDPVGRLALLISLGPAVLLVLGAVMFPLATASLLGPVNELIAATRRVADGDLDARVQVVTSDELGELSYSFNTMTADLRRTTDDLRDSRARIVAASDDSRRRVERDLHDGAQQELVLLNLKLGLLRSKVAGDPDAAAIVAEARDNLARALEQLRDLAHGIYPAVLENDGLPGALADAARRAALPVEVECDGAGRYARELEAAVYFCCLEALQNAGKHAGEGAHATVRLAARNGSLNFEVSDDGCGFEPAEYASSAGLQNMADRIGALGGELAIESAPTAGTRISGSVPLG